MESSERQVGDTVDGRFELLGFGGAGGMGKVFRARDRVSDRIVALKLLDTLAGDRAREAAVLATIDHPGVVRYLDHGVTRAGEQFLVMEWLTGVDLEQWLVRGNLTCEHAIALARRVADALDVMHRQGVVHRDVKPANLLLVDDRIDAVKLVDFGIAGAIEDHGDGDNVIGTPEYMAPEALRGERIDPCADVYGLGAVLFRALSGRPLFTGAQRLAILAKVLLEIPPPICDLRADVPIELEELIGRMLAKDPAQRPLDGGAVLRALDEVEAAASALVGATGSRRRRPTITSGEQRVTCIVMCGGRARGASTVPIARLGVEHGAVDRAARRAGGVLEALSSGSLLIHIDAGTPAERAANAASCALAVAAVRPNTPIIVATGQVVQVGSSAVGEVIDRAAAEVALAERTGVWIDPTTASLLDDRFEIGEGTGWRALVGQRDALAPVRLLLGRRAACVGRTAELASLHAALDDAFATPRLRIALVIGPPGLGKSRLVHELLESPRVASATVLGARGELVRAGAPFAIVSRMLARAANISDLDSPAIRRDKLIAITTPQLAQVLGEIAGVPLDDAAAGPELRAARSDPSMMADALRGAWCEWLVAAAGRGPLVIVLEDLHWGDLPSLRLLEAALAALAASPVLIVATARPEVHDTFPDLWAAHATWELRLGPLAPPAAEQLVRGALGARGDDATVAALVARAGGHPFHLEEMVRAVASGAGAAALPPTVVAMIQARLDVLDPDARRVLRAASVFGETFVADGVAALIGDALPRPDIDRHLAAIRAREVIGLRANGGLEFCHALVRDAAYATLPDAERAIAHRAAGMWLEAVGVADPAVVAEHFERGAAPRRALRQLQRAAEQALEGEDQLRAAGFIERALRCGPDDDERGQLFAIESEVALWRGDFDRAAERALAAADRLVPGTSPWFDALASAITALGQRGHNERVAEQLDRAAVAHASDGAESACATALCRGLTQLYWAHYHGDLSRPQRRVSALVDPHQRDPYRAGWIHRVHAESAWLHGRDLDGCLASYADAEAGFAAARAVRQLCLTRLNSASLVGWSGAAARGHRLVRDGVADATRLGSGFLVAYGRVVEVVLAAWARDPDAPRALRAVLASVANSPRLACLVRVYLGWLADAAGDRVTAEAEAEAALALPAVPVVRAAALALRSATLRRRGELAAAVACAEQAIALESSDLELTEGFAALALAEAHRAAGAPDAARAVLAAAHARIVALAATIADPAQRATFIDRPLPNARIIELASRC